MGEIPNAYREDRQPSKGEKEVQMGNYLVMLFRLLRIPMPEVGDVWAVERTGQLIKRWWSK